MGKLKTVMEDCLEVSIVNGNGTGYKLWMPRALTSTTIMIYHVYMDSHPLYILYLFA